MLADIQVNVDKVGIVKITYKHRDSQFCPLAHIEQWVAASSKDMHRTITVVQG